MIHMGKPLDSNSFYDDKLFNYLPGSDVLMVVGSNLRGVHGAGAALFAKNHKGAKLGVSEGVSGETYLLPTKDINIQSLPLAEIKQHVELFIKYTELYPSKYFFITPIGCGLAGYNAVDIAPMFKGVKRCWLPLSWLPYVKE